LSEAEKTRQAIAHDVQLLMHQKRQLIGELHTLLSQHLTLLQVQETQDERRQSSDIPGSVAAPLSAPQIAGDIGHLAPLKNDLAHTEVKENTRRRQAAYSLEEF
jgi:hypothetical protein